MKKINHSQLVAILALTISYFFDGKTAAALPTPHQNSLQTSILVTSGNGVLPGCTGDGKHDDTACLQRWIDKQQGGMLNLGTGIYLISSALISKSPITLQGSGGGNGIYNASCNSGIRTNTPDQDVLIIQSAGTHIYDLCIDAKVKMTGGTAIRILGHASSSIVSDSYIKNQANGIEVSGTGAMGAYQNADVILRHNTIIPAKLSQATGIVLGRASEGANTVDTRIEGNSLVCQDHLGIGMLIYDSGGALIRNNTQYGCSVGTEIYPGNNQMVAWLYFSNTVLGDTDARHDLLIDTRSRTAAIWGLNFTGTWASNSSGSSILIQDSASSHNILGIHFIGHRTYTSKNQIGIEVRSGQKVTFDSGTVCSDGSSNATGISISGDAIGAAVRTTTVGNCDHNTAGQMASGIKITTDSPNVGVFTGNDLSTTLIPIIWAPAGGANSAAILKDNLGLDTAEKTVTANTTTELPPNPTVLIKGSTAIKWMNGGWAGRTVTILPIEGAINFEPGGNICSAQTVPVMHEVTAHYYSSLHCWIFH